MKQMVEVVNCTIEREMHYQTARVLQFKINYPQFQSVDFSCRKPNESIL